MESLFAMILILSIFVVILLLGGLLGYQYSQKLRFYLNVLLFYFVVMCLAVYMSVYWLIMSPGNHENSRGAASLVRATLCRVFYSINYIIRGYENYPKNVPFVVVANHQSGVDFMSMLTVWPKEGLCTPLVKKELFYLGPFGFGLWLAGAVFIDRQNRNKANTALARTAAQIVDKKLSVWVYPEGTRNHDDGFLPFKTGAFRLAVQAQIPIVPVVFSSYSSFYNLKQKKFEGGDVIVTVMDPVSTAGLTESDVVNISDEIRNKMLKTYNETTTEVESKTISDSGIKLKSN